MTTVTIDNLTVYEQAPGELVAHHCATRRTAQLVASRLALAAAGWTVRSVGTDDGNRRPLCLSGERVGQPLDGSLSDERAQGLSAWRYSAASTDEGRYPEPIVERYADDAIMVDACAGLPLLVLGQRGDVAEARAILEWYLGPLP